MGYFNVSAVDGTTLMSKVSNSNPLEHKPILYRPDIIMRPSVKTKIEIFLRT